MEKRSAGAPRSHCRHLSFRERARAIGDPEISRRAPRFPETGDVAGAAKSCGTRPSVGGAEGRLPAKGRRRMVRGAAGARDVFRRGLGDRTPDYAGPFRASRPLLRISIRRLSGSQPHACRTRVLAGAPEVASIFELVFPINPVITRIRILDQGIIRNSCVLHNLVGILNVDTYYGIKSI